MRKQERLSYLVSNCGVPDEGPLKMTDRMGKWMRDEGLAPLFMCLLFDGPEQTNELYPKS